MAKVSKKKGSGPKSSPYARPAGKAAAGKGSASNAIFRMNTDIGQHVLKNPGIAQAIVDKANLKESDIVLEVGPGSGNLTVLILKKARQCIAAELDPRMAAEVTKRVQGTPEQKKLDVLLGDVMKMDLPYFDVCISNTPYQISSPLTFKLLATQPVPRTCVLMFQQEFAARLFAKAGDNLYSRLSVNVQMWAKVDHVLKVGRNNFKPPPQVDSSVVRITPKNPRPQISYDEWDGMLRICFVRKNKTLRSSFLGTRSVMNLLEDNYKSWCAQNNIPVDDGPVAEAEVDAMEDDQEDDEQDVTMAEDEMPDFFRDQSASQSVPAKTPSKAKRGKVAVLVREKVRKVLEVATKLADQRSRMCDQGDFLNLLYEFNKEGIHFS